MPDQNMKGKAEDKAAEAPVAEETAEAAPAAEVKPKTTKTPAGEGNVAPVEFAKELSKARGEVVPPQMVYGYLKNMKDFPKVDRGEGVVPQIVIPLAEGLAYLESKAKEKAEKAAAKAAAAPAPAPEEASANA
jgi:hypothetical protein